MEAITAKELSFSYEHEESQDRALEAIRLSISAGEFVALIGNNGSGKSTLAKHFNVLLPVQKGELTVAGLDAKLEENTWDIRRKCGMVFQNPDNQFVSSVVEEDIAFGLENFGVEQADIPGKVAAALALVHMPGFETCAPHMLSGGQKQRLAIAGVLAVEPDIIVFDEATAMLDPEGRRQVMETIGHLHKNEHKTVIMITHYIEEAAAADRVFLMGGGRLLAQGTPREILSDKALLDAAGLTSTFAVRMYWQLKAQGVVLPECPITNEELVEQLCRLH